MVEEIGLEEEDLDLLTIDVATERLNDEIQAISEQLAGEGGAEQDIWAAHARLHKLEEAKARVARPLGGTSVK